MRLYQVFLALSLVPAIQISASAQRVFSERAEAVDALSPASPDEAARANAPDGVTVEPATVSEKPKTSPPAAVPTPLGINFDNKLYADTYMDAYRILREENKCSRFFGGAVNATEVLNRLAEQVKKKRFETPDVAMQMSGAVTHVHDRRTGASYRLFEQVEVNSIGPLHVPSQVAQTHRRSIGRFRSETRAARALILLHEIGHLVRGADGRWLLPNDGHDTELSGRNSDTVESHCLQQLTALKH